MRCALLDETSGTVVEAGRSEAHPLPPAAGRRYATQGDNSYRQSERNLILRTEPQNGRLGLD
jgi:hypothetical protein